VANHLFAPADLALHRHRVEAEATLSFDSSWSFTAGASAYAEGAFGENRARYNAPVSVIESQEVVPQEIYLQYRRGPWKIRLGNQQVGWGEAFGAYYADIVNPKDLRQFALGDLAALRIPVPMANIVGIFGRFTAQAIYIPKPYFNKSPALGSDFGLPYPPGSPLSMPDDRTLPTTLENGELGARLGLLVSGFDLGVFAFDYHDRFPTYHLDPGLVLRPEYPRVRSLGTTGSKEWHSFVLRWEGLYTFAPAKDELTAVGGLDYNGFEGWRLGLQVSTIRKLTVQDLLAFHLAVTTWREQSLETVLSYAPRDGSSLSQLRYLVPLSNRFELQAGGDIFLGGARSQFGMFHAASRAFLELRGSLSL
jgi:hypothetical protein